MANYAICILVLNIYNPILNINAVICMKRHTQYWSPLHYTILRVLNFSITHGNRRFKYQTLISCNKNAVYRGITQTLLLETFFRLGWWTICLTAIVGGVLFISIPFSQIRSHYNTNDLGVDLNHSCGQ